MTAYENVINWVKDYWLLLGVIAAIIVWQVTRRVREKRRQKIEQPQQTQTYTPRYGPELDVPTPTKQFEQSQPIEPKTYAEYIKKGFDELTKDEEKLLQEGRQLKTRMEQLVQEQRNIEMQNTFIRNRLGDIRRQKEAYQIELTRRQI